MKCFTCNGTGQVSFVESSLGMKLRVAREWARLSLRDVQKKTEVPPCTLSMYETGTIEKVPFEIVIKLCKLYGIKPEDLVA